MKPQETSLIKTHNFQNTGYPYTSHKTYPLIRKHNDSYELISLCYYTCNGGCEIKSISKFIRYDKHKQSFVSRNFSAEEKTRLVLPIELEKPCEYNENDIDWDKFYHNENALYKYSDLALEELAQRNLSPLVAKHYLTALENIEYSGVLKAYQTLFAETYDELASCANI